MAGARATQHRMARNPGKLPGRNEDRVGVDDPRAAAGNRRGQIIMGDGAGAGAGTSAAAQDGASHAQNLACVQTGIRSCGNDPVRRAHARSGRVRPAGPAHHVAQDPVAGDPRGTGEIPRPETGPAIVRPGFGQPQDVVRFSSSNPAPVSRHHRAHLKGSLREVGGIDGLLIGVEPGIEHPGPRGEFLPDGLGRDPVLGPALQIGPFRGQDGQHCSGHDRAEKGETAP